MVSKQGESIAGEQFEGQRCVGFGSAFAVQSGVGGKDGDLRQRCCWGDVAPELLEAPSESVEQENRPVPLSRGARAGRPHGL